MRFRRKLRYADVVATLALFVALGGGAYAATELPRNSVGNAQLAHSAVDGSKVQNGSLSAIDLALKARPSLAAVSTGGPVSPAAGVSTPIPLKAFGKPYESAGGFRPDPHEVHLVLAAAKGDPGPACNAQVQILLNGIPLMTTPANQSQGGAAVAATSPNVGGSRPEVLTAEVTPRELSPGGCAGLTVSKVTVQVLRYPIALY